MTTPSRLSGKAAVPSSDERTFTDHHGTLWVVSECAMELGTTPARRCLVFESSAITRRVFTFPGTWRDLEPRALERLSWGR